MPTDSLQDNGRLGDFELIEKVGAGGMGEVYRARQISLDRPVAVKVLPSSLARQDTFIERFRREAMKAASLIHPNVIQVYSFGVQDTTPYFAMEYVEGEDLQERVKRVGRLEIEEQVDVVVGVANALSCAAERNIVHRDIKPSNIMMDRNNVVKVMDFGLAKAASDVSTMSSLTESGIIMGTPNYISPEQGRGDPTDGRSDIYSLGIVFYELLTGRLPFQADTPAGLIFKHVYEQPDSLRLHNEDVPPYLENVTLRMLEKDPAERYQNAEALLEELTEFKRNMAHYMTGATERPQSGEYLPASLESSDETENADTIALASSDDERQIIHGLSDAARETMAAGPAAGATDPSAQTRLQGDRQSSAEEEAAAILDDVMSEQEMLASGVVGPSNYDRLVAPILPPPESSDDILASEMGSEPDDDSEHETEFPVEDDTVSSMDPAALVPPPGFEDVPPDDGDAAFSADEIEPAADEEFYDEADEHDGYAPSPADGTPYAGQAPVATTPSGGYEGDVPPESETDPELERLAEQLAAARGSRPVGADNGGGSPVLVTLIIVVALLGVGYFLHTEGYLKEWLGDDTTVAGTGGDGTGGAGTPNGTAGPVNTGLVWFRLSKIPIGQRGVTVKLARSGQQPELELADQQIEPGSHGLIFSKNGYQPRTVEYDVSATGAVEAASRAPIESYPIALEPLPELVEKFERGRDLAEADDLPGAREVLAEVEAVDPGFEGLSELLVSVDERLDVIKQAEKKLREAHIQGALLHGDKKWRKALSLLEEIPRGYPDYPDVLRLVTDSKRELEKIDIRLDQARKAIARGEFEGAEGHVEAVRATDPGNPSVTSVGDQIAQGRAVLAKADAQFDASTWTDARDAYDELLSVAPDFGHASARRDLCQAELDKITAQAARADDLLTRARAARDEGRLEDAAGLIREVLDQVDPEHAEAKALLVEVAGSTRVAAVGSVLEQLDGFLAGGDPAAAAALVDPTRTELVDRLRTDLRELEASGIRILGSSRRDHQWIESTERRVRVKSVWLVELDFPAIGRRADDAKPLRTKVQVPQTLTFVRSGDRWLLHEVQQDAKATAVQ